MKKYFILIFVVILFGFTWAFRKPIYKTYQKYFEKKEKIVLGPGNEYSRKGKFNYVSTTSNFDPKSKEDIKRIYYTALDAGKNTFSFYCNEEYKTCLDDVNDLANNQKELSAINNFVHPFNSFKHIETTYDEYGKVTINIDKLYNENDIEVIKTKVAEIEKEIWTNSMSVEDKIKEAHNYIINHSKYDKERSDNQIVNYKSDSAYGTLLQGYSLCGGYTDSMALFLEDLNIKNFKVSSENHVWNALFLNNKWYHLDLTWDDPITNTGEDILEYNFFLIDSKELKELEAEEHLYDEEIYSELKEG